MAKIFALLTALLLTAPRGVLGEDVPAKPAVDLVASLGPSALKPLAEGTVKIIGSTVSFDSGLVRVRVTTSFGASHMTEIKAEGGRLECRYPQAFPGAPALKPGLLYVDATDYRPYTFTNDPADILIVYRMLQQVKPAVADNRRALADEVLTNLLAMQHRGPDNFALKEASGKQEHYTAGAFHYGMFETGEWLTEGKGWFANPNFRDFAWGGVLNGRAIWALGESMKADPQGPMAGKVGAALELALRFCLNDSLELGYTLRTKSGLPIWNRTAGEHAKSFPCPSCFVQIGLLHLLKY